MKYIKIILTTLAVIYGTVGIYAQDIAEAAKTNNMTKLNQLVNAKLGNINKKDSYGYTALHYALKNKNYSMMKYLLDKGAAIDIKMPDSSTALKYSVLNKDLNAAEMLFLNDKNKEMGIKKGSVIYDLSNIAVNNRYYSMAELLISPLHYIIKRNKPEYFERLWKVRDVINKRDEKKMTPLHIAYLYDNKKFIELLKGKKVDENALDDYKRKPSDYNRSLLKNKSEPYNIHDSTMAKIDDKVYDFLKYHKWMTLGIIKEGKIALLKSYGEGNMINNDAVHASVSKPMTSIIFLQLFKKGYIKNLDDDIGIYSKKYKNVMPLEYSKYKITFREILTHRSGIPHINIPLWKNGKLNLQFKPGAKFAYSTNAYSLLGEIMEEITGKKFTDLVKEYISKPIAANSFWAENHFRAPAARIHSTTADFAKFALGIINNQYLSHQDLDSLLIGKKEGESLGWGVGKIGEKDIMIGHSGSNGKERSHIQLVPERKLGVILMGEAISGKDEVWFIYLASIILNIIYAENNNLK